MRKKETLEAGMPVNEGEFVSGDVVEPGMYEDVVTGARVTVLMQDELPHGVRVVRFPRRFRRMESAARQVTRRAA